MKLGRTCLHNEYERKRERERERERSGGGGRDSRNLTALVVGEC